VDTLIELLVDVWSQVDRTNQGVANGQDQCSRPGADLLVGVLRRGRVQGFESRLAYLLQALACRFTFFKFVAAQLFDEELDGPVVWNGFGSRDPRRSPCLSDGASWQEGEIAEAGLFRMRRGSRRPTIARGRKKP
jgi:hypothetical protein